MAEKVFKSVVIEKPLDRRRNLPEAFCVKPNSILCEWRSARHLKRKGVPPTVFYYVSKISQHTYPRALGNFLFATMGIEHLTVSERRLALCQERRKRRYTAVCLPSIR